MKEIGFPFFYKLRVIVEYCIVSQPVIGWNTCCYSLVFNRTTHIPLSTMNLLISFVSSYQVVFMLRDLHPVTNTSCGWTMLFFLVDFGLACLCHNSQLFIGNYTIQSTGLCNSISSNIYELLASYCFKTFGWNYYWASNQLLLMKHTIPNMYLSLPTTILANKYDCGVNSKWFSLILWLLAWWLVCFKQFLTAVS